MNRRDFLVSGTLGFAALTGLTQALAAATDSKDRAKIKWGCAAITWNGQDEQAIKEIGTLGFKGIQLRGNTFDKYRTKTDDLKALLKDSGIKMPILSGGGGNPTNEEANQKLMNRWDAMGAFASTLGAEFLQITTGSRNGRSTIPESELEIYGKFLTEAASMVMEKHGVQVVYHNHMDQLGEKPDEIAAILKYSDPKKVKFLLDIAHYQQGGGLPAEAILKHRERLAILHIKDLKPKDKSYQFVELGNGGIDLKAVFSALDSIKFRGWCMVELDSIPDKEKTALQCSETSKNWLINNVGAKF